MLDTANDGRRRKEGISNILLLGKVEEKQYVMDSEEGREASKVWVVGEEKREKEWERGKGGREGEREFFLSLILSLPSLSPPLSLFSLLLPPCPVAASGGLFQEDTDGCNYSEGTGKKNQEGAGGDEPLFRGYGG